MFCAVVSVVLHVNVQCVQFDLIVINCHNELCPVVNMNRTVLIEIVKRREREGERGRGRERGEGGVCEQL